MIGVVLWKVNGGGWRVLAEGGVGVAAGAEQRVVHGAPCARGCAGVWRA